MDYRSTLANLESLWKELEKLSGLSSSFAAAYQSYINDVQKPGLEHLERAKNISSLPLEERTPLLIKELPIAEKILSSAKKLEDKYPKEVIFALKKDGDSFYDNIFGPAGVSSSNFAKEQAKKKKEVSADDLFLLYQSRIKELLEQEQNFDTYQEALNVIEEYKDVDISRMEKEEKDFISFIQKSKKDIIAFPSIQETIGEANPQESDDYKAFAKRFKELDSLEKEINSLDIKIIGQENIDQLKANYSEAVKETEDALNQKIHQFLNNSDKGYEDFIAFEKDFKPIGFDENSRKHIDLDDGKYDLLSRSGTIAKNWKSTFISEDAYAHDAKGGLSHAKKFDKSVIGSSYDEVISRYRSIIGKGRKAAFGAGVGSFFGGIGAALQWILMILLILLPLALIGLQAYESVMELALPEGNWVGGIIGGIFYGIVRAAGSMFGLPFLVLSFYHATLLDANLEAIIGAVSGGLLLIGFLLFAILENRHFDFRIPYGFRKFFYVFYTVLLAIALIVSPFAVSLKEALTIYNAGGATFFTVFHGLVKAIESPLVLLFGGYFFAADSFAGWSIDLLMFSITVWAYFVLLIAAAIFYLKLAEDLFFDGFFTSDPSPYSIALIGIWVLFFYYLLTNVIFSMEEFMVLAPEGGPIQGPIAGLVGFFLGLAKVPICLVGGTFYWPSFFEHYGVNQPFYPVIGLLLGYTIMVFHLINKPRDYEDIPGFFKAVSYIGFFAVLACHILVPLIHPIVFGASFGEKNPGFIAYLSGLTAGGITGSSETSILPSPILWNIFLYTGFISFVPGLIFHIKLAS